MNHAYNDYQRRTWKLETSLRPVLDKNNYQARKLGWELHELSNDFAQKKDPGAIDARMKGIERHLSMMQNSGTMALPKDHSADVYQNMSTMRQSIQSMPRYYKK